MAQIPNTAFMYITYSKKVILIVELTASRTTARRADPTNSRNCGSVQWLMMLAIYCEVAYSDVEMMQRLRVLSDCIHLR